MEKYKSLVESDQETNSVYLLTIEVLSPKSKTYAYYLYSIKNEFIPYNYFNTNYELGYKFTDVDYIRDHVLNREVVKKQIKLIKANWENSKIQIKAEKRIVTIKEGIIEVLERI